LPVATRSRPVPLASSGVPSNRQYPARPSAVLGGLGCETATLMKALGDPVIVTEMVCGPAATGCLSVMPAGLAAMSAFPVTCTPSKLTLQFFSLAHDSRRQTLGPE